MLAITALSAALSATVYTFKPRPEGFARWWSSTGIVIFILLWMLFAVIF